MENPLCKVCTHKIRAPNPRRRSMFLKIVVGCCNGLFSDQCMFDGEVTLSFIGLKIMPFSVLVIELTDKFLINYCAFLVLKPD